MNSISRSSYRVFIVVLAAVFIFPLVFNPVSAQEEEAAGMKVQRIVICTAISEREPVGEGESFPVDVKKVFCFTEVLDADKDTFITHEWYYQDELKASVKLKVAGKRWRTWSSKGIDKNWTGEWRVEVKDENGNLLVSQKFKIGEKPESNENEPAEKTDTTETEKSEVESDNPKD